MIRLINSTMVSVLFVSLLFCSCRDRDKETDKASVAVDMTSITADSDGESFSVNVTANCYWTVQIPVDASAWITATPETGTGNESFVVNVEKNSYMQARSTTIRVLSIDQSSSVDIAITQSAANQPPPTFEGVSMPVCSVFLNKSNDDASQGPSNGTVSATSFQFDSGVKIERIGGTPNLKYSFESNFYEVALNTTGWNEAECHWLISIPFKEDTFGDFKLLFGARISGSAPTDWKMEWSADGNTWNTPTNGSYAVSSSGRMKTIEFSIPESGRIAAGATLYIKLSPLSTTSVTTDGIVRFDSGIVLYPAAIVASSLPSENVVFAHGFDDATTGVEYTFPIWYMRSAFGDTYGDIALTHGMVTGGNVRSTYGSIMLGSSSNPGSITTPALEKIGEVTTDLKVTCRAIAYLPATGISAGKTAHIEIAEGPGNINEGEGAMTNLDNEEWNQQTMYVRGATKKTRIKFTSDTGGDNRFLLDDIVIYFEGEPTYPDPEKPIAKAITVIRGLASNITASAPIFTISDNWSMTGRVVSNRTEGNMDADVLALSDGTQAGCGIFVKLPNAHQFNAGDEVCVELKGGQMAYLNGTLGVAVAADKVTKTQNAVKIPVPTAITASQLASGDYEGQYVSIDNCQVSSADIATKMTGTVSIETTDNEHFKMLTLAGASFASQTVPQGSGTLKGVAVKLSDDNMIAPQSAYDFASMSATRFDLAAPQFTITPLKGIFLNTEAAPAVITNGSLSGDRFSFAEGGVTIERIGGNGNMTTSNQTYWYYPCLLSDSWTTPNSAWLVTFTTVSEIYDQLIAMFCINGAKTKWNFAWSTDNTNWTEITEGGNLSNGVLDITSASASYKFVEFTIPRSQKISSGGKLYLRMTLDQASSYQTAATPAVTAVTQLRLRGGIYLESALPPRFNAPVGADVLFMHGFDKASGGGDYMIGGTNHLGSLDGANYETLAAEYGITAKTTYQRHGYIKMGSSATAGSFTTPALEAIGEGATDITVSFKACVYQAATLVNDKSTLLVTVNGAGTVVDGGPFTDIPVEGWTSKSVVIKGATKETKVVIKTAEAGSRTFLDEVVITRNATAQSTMRRSMLR